MKEAKNNMDSMINNDMDNTIDNIANNISKALRKQIPRKVSKFSYFYGRVYGCPCCDNHIGKEKNRTIQYCNHCGQALDWSET